MNIEIADSPFSRLRGLLCRRDYPDVLLLTRCNDVHTFGMTRAIDVAFITPDGTVLESHRHVGALRRLHCKPAAATLERLAVETPWPERGEKIELKHLIKDAIVS